MLRPDPWLALDHGVCKTCGAKKLSTVQPWLPSNRFYMDLWTKNRTRSVLCLIGFVNVQSAYGKRAPQRNLAFSEIRNEAAPDWRIPFHTGHTQAKTKNEGSNSSKQPCDCKLLRAAMTPAHAGQADNSKVKLNIITGTSPHMRGEALCH
jgi:hypothetical protein